MNTFTAPPFLKGKSLRATARKLLGFQGLNRMLFRLVHECTDGSLKIGRALISCETVVIGVLRNGRTDFDRNLTHGGKRRIERALFEVSFAHEFRKFSGGGKEHAHRHRLGTGENGSEAKPREYVAVVALTRNEGLAVEIYGSERGAGSEQSAAVRFTVGRSGIAFRT